MDDILYYYPLVLPSNTRGLNPAAVAELVGWNAFYYGHYQPVNVARTIFSLDWNMTAGRPMGNFNQGIPVVNAPQSLAGNWPDRAWPSGSPLSILSWVKTQTARIMQGPGRV